MIWSSNIDTKLQNWRIANVNFLLTAAIFVVICFSYNPGLAFLISLNFLCTWSFEIFHITAFFSIGYTELKSQLGTPS